MIGREEGNGGCAMAAATAMKKRRIEEEEARTLASQIPDDKEGLLEFMDQRAKSIQLCKDQISILERKLAEERKLMEDAETKFLQLDRVESDSFSKGKPKVSGGTGSLLDEVKTANGTSSTPYVRGEKMEYETSAPRSRSEMDPSKLPPIILPPSFRRKASSASVRSEVSESAQAQPAVRRSYSFPREEAKRSHSTISNGVVREVQARDSHTDKGFAKPRIRVSSNISGQARQEKSEFNGNDELIALIGRSSLRPTIKSRTVAVLPSGHTKRMRSLAVSLSNRDLFATSALDCVVHFCTRVAWSPDGNFIGVSFTKHLIHVYAYQGSDLRQHLEIDAHVGRVNDLAFAHPNKQICVVTCGDDKLIKVWDINGKKLYTFEGHEASVYSICPHQKENIQFIFSTALDGKIKAWLYDNVGSRVDYDAPGQWCTTMLYSADGSRLFSCGTSKDGDSFLVEWNESEGALKRTYVGFRKKSNGVVQFDTTRNRFLAVGEDNQVKFWDMDNTNMLTTVEAEGGLPSLPRLRFNKEGNLLAVSTADNGFKILANTDGLRILRAYEARSHEASKASIEMKVSTSAMVSSMSPAVGKIEHMDTSSPARPTPLPNGIEAMSRSIEKPRNLESAVDKPKPLELTEIVDPTQCRQVTMPDSKDSVSKVARLLYTNSGVGVLALGANGVQRLWKWSRSEQNPTGKATASVTPQHWQPNSGLLMANDVSENPEAAVPCIALSKNDSYVMSACGGKVSLFNMMTFKVMTTFMPPPPASTFLAFHPQDNNIIAIGMEDSSIHIYNVRVDEVKTKLKGHQKHITGLAFSTALNTLVSSGADAQLFFWTADTWEKKKSSAISLPPGKAPVGDTRVQFHNDQIHLLVSHETQLAIYDATKMECIHKWVPQEALSSPITSASYSCNSQLVYASFADGNIAVFDADSLRLRCRIAPSAYMPQPTPNSAPIIPQVITTHPLEPNQLAVGFSDGSVKVIEPSEASRRWGVGVSVTADKAGTENGRPSSSSAANNNSSSDHQQIQR